MILPCAACGAQNFIAPERMAAVPPPPRCWRCGAVLDTAAETPCAGRESNRGNGKSGTRSGESDA